MQKRIGLIGTAVTGAALLLWFASSTAEAPRVAPPGQQGGRPGLAATQPGTFVLLGAGLVALGFYAKRKNHKNS
jgi:hypothetical protein